MVKVDVVSFKTGYCAVYVGGLQVGAVSTRDDGRFVVNNDTPSFMGYSFGAFKDIVLFTTAIMNNALVPSYIDIAYDNPLNS